MAEEVNCDEGCHPRRISRRDFVKLAAASLLAACQPAPEMATATRVLPTMIPTPSPLPTLDPAATPVARRPEVIRFYPHAPSRVVHTHHAGVWDREKLVPGALRQMLDASITQLTGLNDADEAWAALFDPGERIAIKVNTLAGRNGSTHAPLVYAVTDRLQASGVPAEQIIIWDRLGMELTTGDFIVNKSGSGVRCGGTDNNYTAGWKLMGEDIKLSNILLECDALINMPVLKSHGSTGITFAMKNHYGSFYDPRLAPQFHSKIERALVELNAIPEIKDRTRLIIGDVLEFISGMDWGKHVPGDAILMSFDPVAHDAVGLQLFLQAIGGQGYEHYTRWLPGAAAVGLGTDDPAHMDLVEVNLA